jgi:hypothetical protein
MTLPLLIAIAIFYAVALTDAYTAVYDADFHYEFWRPVTAIRNGDFDGNPDTQPTEPGSRSMQRRCTRSILAPIAR